MLNIDIKNTPNMTDLWKHRILLLYNTNVCVCYDVMNTSDWIEFLFGFIQHFVVVVVVFVFLWLLVRIIWKLILNQFEEDSALQTHSVYLSISLFLSISLYLFLVLPMVHYSLYSTDILDTTISTLYGHGIIIDRTENSMTSETHIENIAIQKR